MPRRTLLVTRKRRVSIGLIAVTAVALLSCVAARAPQAGGPQTPKQFAAAMGGRIAVCNIDWFGASRGGADLNHHVNGGLRFHIDQIDLDQKKARVRIDDGREGDRPKPSDGVTVVVWFHAGGLHFITSSIEKFDDSQVYASFYVPSDPRSTSRMVATLHSYGLFGPGPVVWNASGACDIADQPPVASAE